MTTIINALQAVKQRILQAAMQAGRDPQTIQLLAVSKTVDALRLREAYAAGQHAFGESYVQEALSKVEAMQDLQPEWHFIGPLQSNKTRVIAEIFDWVHSVDRVKLAQRLSEQRPTHLPPMNVCLQVNISGEASKSGVAPGEVGALAQLLTTLPKIKLRGLMAIPAPTEDVLQQRAQFRCLRELLESLQDKGYVLDTLSMGMSDDLEAAIAEGATIVRVGSAIFGSRLKA